MLSEAMANAPMVSGICQPMPSISLTFSLCVRAWMAPAQKKSVIFVRPWPTMCRSAPVSAIGPSTAAPSTM